MRKLLEKLTKEEIIDFIKEYATNDSKFANAVNVSFGQPDFKQELKKMGRNIDEKIDSASSYRRHNNWGYVNVNTDDIVAEIDKRAEQGHIRLAFAETEMLYRKLLEIFDEQEECEVADEAEECLIIMSEIADRAVSDEDKKYIFENCIALADIDDGKDYGADYEDKLLRIAAKFVTPQNRAELEEAIELYDFEWRREELQLIRLEIIRKLEGEKAADNFITGNLQFPKVREIAFDNAIVRNNLSDAEQLCSDVLSMYATNYGVSPWLYKLYSVHELMKNSVKMADTAEKILLCGDLKYYDILKSLLEQQAIWNKSYPELLQKCEYKLSYSKYMEILEKENEYALLLEQLQKHPAQIYIYGKLLAEKYPVDIRAIFTEQITKEAERATKRESYNIVGSHIAYFAETGYNEEANDMITNFKLEYKRKSAFVDELNKVKI